MGLGHNPSPITDGIVLNLDAANVRSYPGSGTAWSDLSATGNNGTLVSSPTFVNTNGGTLEFNGTSQYADCGYNSTIYNLTQNFTVETWIRWTGAVATSGNGQWIIANVDVSTTNGGFQQGYIPGTGFYFGTYGNLVAASYSFIPTINTWYCLTGIKSSTSGYFVYLNGIQVASTVNLTAAGAASRNLRIAHRERDGAGTGYFPGYVPSVKIYNRALTANEISLNFNALRGRFGI